MQFFITWMFRMNTVIINTAKKNKRSNNLEELLLFINCLTHPVFFFLNLSNLGLLRFDGIFLWYGFCNIFIQRMESKSFLLSSMIDWNYPLL